MRSQRYFDTFPATIAGSCANFVPAKILVGIWNAPVICIIVLWSQMMVWQHRADMRRHLGRLEHTQLRDVGIAPLDARREFSKPFWRA